MKKTFFCVMSEFYANGTVKAAITTRNCKEIPENIVRRLPGMTARMDWFADQDSAEAFLSEKAAA